MNSADGVVCCLRLVYETDRIVTLKSIGNRRVVSCRICRYISVQLVCSDTVINNPPPPPPPPRKTTTTKNKTKIDSEFDAGNNSDLSLVPR